MFVRLLTIHALIDSISYPLMAVVQATGKIRLYQSVVGGARILNLPVSYIFLKLGFAAEVVFIVEISISVISLILRLVILQRIINEKLFFPFFRLLLFFLFITALSSVAPFFVIRIFKQSFLWLVIFVSISIIWSSIIIFLIGLNRNEKQNLIGKIKKLKINSLEK